MDMSSEQAPGTGDGYGILACYILWGHKESGMTEWLNWTDSLLCLVHIPQLQYKSSFCSWGRWRTSVWCLLLLEGLVLPRGQCWHISFARTSGLRGYAFISWLHKLLVAWLSASCYTVLCLGFLICEMVIFLILNSWCYFQDWMRWCIVRHFNPWFNKCELGGKGWGWQREIKCSFNFDKNAIYLRTKLEIQFGDFRKGKKDSHMCWVE